jgi:two-component system cell cycle sensor histidine kinase/response regulator CckA
MMKDENKTKEQLINELSKMRLHVAELEKSEIDLKRAKESLRESESRLKLTLEAVNDGVWDWNILTSEAIFSPSYYTMIGYEPYEFPQNYESWRNLVHPDDIDRAEREINDRIANNEGYSIEIRLRTKTGDWRWILTRGKTVEWDTEGKPIRMVGTHSEITERKQAEEALRESEKKFRDLADLLPQVVFEFNLQGCITYVNRFALDMFGYSQADIENGLNALDMIAPSDRERAAMNIMKVMKKEIKTGIDYTAVRKNGEEFPVIIYSTPIHADEKVIGLRGIIVDFTERKKMEDALRESEEKYSAVVRQAKDGVILIQDNIIKYANEAMADILGYTVSEIENTPYINYVAHESRATVASHVNARFAGKHVPQFYEAKLLHKNGTLRDAELSAKVIQYRGKPLDVGIIRDITDRKEMEQILKESEERFRLAFENANIGVCLVNIEGRLIRVNDQMSRIFGYSREALEQMTVNDIAFPEDIVLSPSFIKQSLSGEIEKTTFEKRYIHKNGHVVWCQVSSSMVRNTDGALLYFISHIQDITERKKTEEELKRERETFFTILKYYPHGIVLVDRQGINQFVNPEFTQITGYTIEDIPTGMDWFQKAYPIPEYREKVIDAWKTDRIKTGIGVDRYFSITCKDGTVRDIEFTTTFLDNGSITVLNDVTERNKAEDKLRESQQRLIDIIEFLPDATLVIDKEGKVIAWNRAIETMTGIKKEDMLGKGNHEYALPFYGDRRPILIDLALHPNREMEKQYTAIQRVGDILFGEAFTPTLPPGDVHLSATASVLRDDAGEITAAIECIRDNTERKRLEERLNRAEKMEILGRLAGGVAHDLNNVLGVLVGYSELLLERLSEDNSLRRYADNILKSSVRGSAIIQDLLTLARRGVSVSKVVDLNRVIFDYLRTPEFEKLKSYHPDVKIWTELEEGLLNIKGSPIHLGKTIMNLVSNAAEAISGQGEVTIRTENRYLDKPIRGYDEMREGDYAILTVTDTGSGISANDLGKIFEPFYTKKVMGRSGTGLGLAVVWGTVKDHNGYIDVQSEEGEGTTFTLYFPITREEIEKAEKAIYPEYYMSKGESILVVDDVKEQRELAITMLNRLGYQVDAVASGEEAIEYLKNKQTDLIILDMIMDPGIDGMETYRRILEINAGQKAIIVSGFSETDRVRKTLEMGAGVFVRKPYILEKIGLSIRKELDRK